MTCKVKIDLTDNTGYAQEVGDRIIFRAKNTIGSPSIPGRVISTAPATVELINGKAETQLEPGPTIVTIRARNYDDNPSEFVVTVPDDVATMTFRELLEGQFNYEPPVLADAQRYMIQAREAAEAAQASQELLGSAESIITNRDAAAASARAAKTSETNAKASENAAKTSETNAKASEVAAAASQAAALASQNTATEQAEAAEVSRADSQAKAEASGVSAAASLASENAAKAAQQETENLRDATRVHAEAADLSDTSAGNNADRSEQARDDSIAAAEASEASKEGAATHEQGAQAKATAAAESATTATTQATAAAGSATSAATKESSAAAYADTAWKHRTAAGVERTAAEDARADTENYRDTTKGYLDDAREQAGISLAAADTSTQASTTAAAEVRAEFVGYKDETVAARDTTFEYRRDARLARDAAKASEEAAADAVASGVADASDTVKGKVMLTGDLAGSADNPRVPALSLTGPGASIQVAARTTGWGYAEADPAAAPTGWSFDGVWLTPPRWLRSGKVTVSWCGATGISLRGKKADGTTPEVGSIPAGEPEQHRILDITIDFNVYSAVSIAATWAQSDLSAGCSATMMVQILPPHTHGKADVPEVMAEVNNRVKLDDTRLTDSRTPKAHKHPLTDLEDMPALTSEPTQRTVARRDAEGNIGVGTATANNHAVNKAMLDSRAHGHWASTFANGQPTDPLPNARNGDWVYDITNPKKIGLYVVTGRTA